MQQIGGKKVAQQKYNYLTTQLPKYLNSVPKVSIIMNCFNGSKYLRESIDSVYAQTYRNWEIIFWDNASTDNSAEIAKNYDSRLRYFRSERNYPLVGK
ncbi:MAG: glycosyltransferase, partial [Patescibacteria group bacterium]